MSVIALPCDLPGRVFRSPMPFGQYDLHGEVYDRLCEEQIAVIVLLASDEACLHKTGRNLRALYLEEGFQASIMASATLVCNPASGWSASSLEATPS
jgi:hypothetical protein